jgi:hypothetical protein
MKLFLDNTGMHAVGRCLDKEGLGQIDVKGLLQFATGIIFSEKITVSGFEREGMRDRSEYIKSLLIGAGLSKEVIEIKLLTHEEFGKACDVAMSNLSDDFPFVFNELMLPQEIQIEALKPKFLPEEQATEDTIHTLFTYLVTQERKQQQLDDIYSTALKDPRLGLTLDTVLHSHSLWEQVREYSQEYSWTPQTSKYLLTTIRYYVNLELADNIDSFYSPAVARAELLRKKQPIHIELLSTIVKDATEQLSPTDIGAPRVATALVRKAKGDPMGVIKEAVYFRSLADDLRAYLGNKLEQYQSGDPNWNKKLHEEAANIAATLREELKIDRRPELWRAMSVTPGIPIISGGLEALSEWNRYRRLRKKVIVLTELSETIAYNTKESYAYEKLIKNSCSQSSNIN